MACNAGWSASSGASWAAIARRRSASAAAGSSASAGAADALLALCALLLGAAPYAPAEDDAETAPGAARGTAGGPAARSGGSPNAPAASSAPGDDSEPEREDALSPPDADRHVQDPDETAPFGDEGSEDEISVLPAPEGRGARAHDGPYAVDPYDA